MQNQAQIDQVLRQKTEAREIPGVVAMAANSNEVMNEPYHYIAIKRAERPPARHTRNNKVAARADLYVGQTKRLALQTNARVVLIDRSDFADFDFGTVLGRR